MKKRAKIIVSATAVAIISLMITAYLAEQQTPPNLPTNRPVSEVVEADKAYTPPTKAKPLVGEEMPQINTPTRELSNQQPKKPPHHSQQEILNRPLHQPQLHKRL